LRQELRKVEEARKAPAGPSARLAEFHAERNAARAAAMSPETLRAYRRARKQVSRRRWQHTQQHQEQQARERAERYRRSWEDLRRRDLLPDWGLQITTPPNSPRPAGTSRRQRP